MEKVQSKYCSFYYSLLIPHLCEGKMKEYVSKEAWDDLELKHKSRGQKKSHSFAEALFNTVFGFGISMVDNLIVLPMFGIKISLSNAFNIGAIFTLISIVRSYVLRRVFNRIIIWSGNG